MGPKSWATSNRHPQLLADAFVAVNGHRIAPAVARDERAPLHVAANELETPRNRHSIKPLECDVVRREVVFIDGAAEQPDRRPVFNIQLVLEA